MSRAIALMSLFMMLPPIQAEVIQKKDTHLRRLAPWITEQTLAVAYLDLSRISWDDALRNKLARVSKWPGKHPDLFHWGCLEWLTGLSQSGAEELYFLIDLIDLSHEPPLAVVPLSAKAAHQKIEAALRQKKFFPEVQLRGQTLVAGSAQALRKLAKHQPVTRPELTEALKTVGNAPIWFLILPNEDLRRAFEEVMPHLPREIGAPPVQGVTRGVRWIAVTLKISPVWKLHLTIQSADAAAARQLHDLLKRYDLLLKTMKPKLHPLIPLLTFPWVGALGHVEEDRLQASLTDKEVEPVLAPVLDYLGVSPAAWILHNLRLLSQGMIAYADSHPKHRLPAVASFDKKGRPLLSWRVHILPYIGQEKLYREFHLDEPWDSEHNKTLISRMPKIYYGPNLELNRQGKTIYLAPVGKDLVFTGETEGRRYPVDFLDGTSNTILLVEADDAHAVIWTKPEDLRVDRLRPHQGLGGHIEGRFAVSLADGSARLVWSQINPATLHAALTPAGGETLGEDWQ
jgi:hypothetical protein